MNRALGGARERGSQMNVFLVSELVNNKPVETCVDIESKPESTEINERLQRSFSCRIQTQITRQVWVNPQLILEIRDQTVGP